MSKANQLGACEAILSGVSTLKDGSVKITLEINPSEDDVITKLIQKYLANERLFTVGFVSEGGGY